MPSEKRRQPVWDYRLHAVNPDLGAACQYEYELDSKLRSGYRRAKLVGNQRAFIKPENLIIFWLKKDINPLVCFYCGCDIWVTEDGEDKLWHLDHKDPVSRGGSHTADNLVPSCVPCNLRKGSSPLIDYIEARIADLEAVLDV